MARTGTADPLTENAAILLRAWLVTRQMDWDKSHGDSVGYDEAVFALITATLKEYGVTATDAATQTMCSRSAAAHGGANGMSMIHDAIRASAEEGYFHTYIRLTPAQKIAIERLGFETIEVLGNYKIVWGKD